MNVTHADLRAQRHRLGRRGQIAIRAGLVRARSKHVDLLLAEAIASRETNMQNITGDGGHGRGMFQQDDRFQQPFLRKARGCLPGTSRPRFRSALPAGRVPMISTGAYRMAQLIEENIAAAARLGVPRGKRTRFALAAYNAGVGGATSGYRTGDVDSHTAGGDYSADVLARYHALKGMR